MHLGEPPNRRTCRQAAAVDLLRIGHRDVQQRPITGVSTEVCDDLRRTSRFAGYTETAITWLPASQARLKVLRGSCCQGHETRDGAADLSKENCRDHSDRVEERSVLRRPTSETTNSLSVKGSVANER